MVVVTMGMVACAAQDDREVTWAAESGPKKSRRYGTFVIWMKVLLVLGRYLML